MVAGGHLARGGVQQSVSFKGRRQLREIFIYGF